ncbi:MAG: NAD(P)-dependent oxidoreductase, partial [Pseudomonadota bacterium]|nr:NAD(P)-dependent oxidoreductase [Pseudomonadota bacterium]
MAEQISRVGVVGLGAMGMGMAQSLLRAGFEVHACDVRPEAVEKLVASGAHGATSPAELAGKVEALLIVVVNAAQTEQVLFGASGAAAHLKPGAIVIASATVAPEFAESLGARLEAMGLRFIDAPISGGAAKAATGEMSVMAAGAPETFAVCTRLFDAICAKLYRLGDQPGQGSKVKMINQLLAGVHIAAASEAIAFAAKQGLDIRRVYEVITASAGNSWMFENRMPHVLDGDYTPRSAVEIFVKDLGIIQDMARTARFP